MVHELTVAARRRRAEAGMSAGIICPLAAYPPPVRKIGAVVRTG